MYLRYILKKLQSFFYSHIKYIIDIFALISDFQSFSVIALTAADFARHVYIR